MISRARKIDKDILSLFQRVGRASLVYDIQDSHSGNMSVALKDKAEKDGIFITAAGSQKGDLEPDQICLLPSGRSDRGEARPSSETNVHRHVLSLPGVGAVVHAHAKDLTVATLDDDEKPSRPPDFVPVDPLGFHHLGDHIHVDWISVPSGSPEMAALIPKRLAVHPVTVVQAHGIFARGRTLTEAFFFACVANNAGAVVRAAERLGIDVEALRNEVKSGPAAFFSHPPNPYAIAGDEIRQFPEDVELTREFWKAGGRIFESRLSPFHTGSMSARGGNRLLYAPKASMPRDLPGPLLRLGLNPEPDDPPEVRLHKTICAETDVRSVMHCYLPEAEAHAHFRYPGEDAAADRIIAIDAEGSYLCPVVPIVPAGVDVESLIRSLRQYKVVVFRGGGVWAVGLRSLSEALHHLSSLRDICLYRIGAFERGLDLRKTEPKKAKKWQMKGRTEWPKSFSVL